MSAEWHVRASEVERGKWIVERKIWVSHPLRDVLLGTDGKRTHTFANAYFDTKEEAELAFIAAMIKGVIP